MPKKRTIAACAGLLVTAGAVGVVWWNRLRPPYELADAPAIDVTVQAEKSDYPDVAETAADVDTLVRVYVQRLRARDVNGLTELSGPAYRAPEPVAEKYVRELGAAAAGHVEVTVLESAVPYFNPVRLTYERTGERQELLLVKDDGHWWIGLGDGDPAAGR
jgi:hypothetical protein